MEINIDETVYGKPENEYIPITLKTKKGNISCRFYKVPQTNLGAIWVGGVGGGFDTPAKGLYPDLSKKLMKNNISSFRIKYRNPTNLEECVYDVITGIKFLESEKISKIAITGHSLGGAAVIKAAALCNSVKTVITLATQSFGTDEVKDFSEDTSILLIHGIDDSVLPSSCSRIVYGLAHEPKERIILSGNGHCLDDSSDNVKETVNNWIISQLKTT